ncbi:MAG: paraquat-inducible protein A, partial [Bdellovibrio sp.]
DSWRTVIFSLTALIFYLPANILPFITVDLYGSHNTPTIWGGVVTLTESGSWPIAIVIFLASMVIPLLKILALFYLSATARNGENKKLKTYIYQTVEAIGRWSMLDIFLLAILVAVMKLGTWAHAEPEVGSLMFLFVVIFTMLASASFNPKIIWEQNNEES